MSVILFTGQSGISVRECLKRLSRQVDPQPRIISVEEKMTEISGKSFPREILLENISYQYELWKDAFNQIYNLVSDLDETIFLTLHGVYYHQDKREFVSPIDLELIVKLKGKVRMLIDFIDDIYDVYRRLMANGQMYSFVRGLEPLEALYTSIFNLISILEWRQIEITISRLIARVLDIPMYIVATKHPISMIAKLINIPMEDLSIFYLAHPISSVRKDAMEQLPNFVGELNWFAKTVMDLKNTILFLPGTIDELIIKKKNDIYLPELLPRWPLPYGKESWISPPLPKALEDINPLNPLNYNIASSSEVKMSVSYLLKLLCECISVQITSRDLSLVEQSKNGVIAYRPYFPYKLSGGIRRELEHNYRLYEKESSRRSIILSVLEDKGKARIKRFFTLVEKLIENLDETTKQRLQEKCDEWICQSTIIKLFSNDAVLKEESTLTSLRKELEKILPPDYNFQLPRDFLFNETSLPPGYIGQRERDRRAGFQYAVDTCLKDPLKDYLISERNYLEFSSPDEINHVDISKIILKNQNKQKEVK